ncbi:hypothetical protein SAMN02910301_1931 [Lachnospiraceae bacterium XBD2001]|nr:hypothetical protein SAMN02910301_1931 [Lachnospiraceae bacterium XBD2001]
MATKRKIKNWGQVGILAIVLVAFVILMSFGLVLRDYRLENTGNGIHWVSKYPVPTVGNLTVRSDEPGKIEMSTREVAGVGGYEFRVSRFKNMWFSKTYRTTKTTKELGMMPEGKTYYVQVRGYKQNDAGRTVFGQYSTTRNVTIRKHAPQLQLD